MSFPSLLSSPFPCLFHLVEQSINSPLLGELISIALVQASQPARAVTNFLLGLDPWNSISASVCCSLVTSFFMIDFSKSSEEGLSQEPWLRLVSALVAIIMLGRGIRDCWNNFSLDDIKSISWSVALEHGVWMIVNLDDLVMERMFQQTCTEPELPPSVDFSVQCTSAYVFSLFNVARIYDVGVPPRRI